MNISRPRCRRRPAFQLISSFGLVEMPVMPFSDLFFVLAPASEYPLAIGLLIVPDTTGAAFFVLPTFTTSVLF
jgi:hypothetical protein